VKTISEYFSLFIYAQQEVTQTKLTISEYFSLFIYAQQEVTQTKLTISFIHQDAFLL
jgi:hypothetical protein